MQAWPRVPSPCLCLSCYGMRWGLLWGPWPGAVPVMGKGRDVAGADVKPVSHQLWPGGCDPPCQQKGFRTHTAPSVDVGFIPCSPCLGRRGGRACALGSGRGGSCWQWCPPPPSSAEGSAEVGFGCPPFACPQGPASCVADPPWGQAGPLGSASKGFPSAGAEGQVPAGPLASVASGDILLLLLIPPAPCMLVTWCAL